MSKSSIALQTLTSDNAKILWLSSCRREVMRLLRHASNTFDEKQLKVLINAIIKGPPRDIYREMPDQEWLELKHEAILHRLKKLEDSQVPLPTKAQKILEKEKSKVKESGTKNIANSKHKDEFPFYMTSGWSDDFDYGERRKPPNQIKEMPAEAFEKYLLENRDWDEAWMNYCKEYSEDAFTKLLAFAKKNKEWPHHRWSAAFYSFRQKMTLSSEENREYSFDKAFAEKVLASISEIPDEVLRKPQVSQEASKFIDFRTFSGETPDKIYWSVWEKLWYASVDLVEDGDYDLRTKALNTACGELAEQLIYHASNLKLEKGSDLPSDIKRHANMVVDSQGQGALIGRLMLVSRLSFLFNIAPDWSKEKLTPLLSKDSNPDEWMHMWIGFMWSPRVYPNLYLSIKGAFFDLIDNIGVYSEKFDKDREDEAERVAQLLGYLCIPENTRVTRKEAKVLLNKLNSKLLSEVAYTLKTQLKGAENGKAATMWQEQIKPWFLYAWPIKNSAKESNVSGTLADMCLHTEEAFPDCVKTLLGYIGSIHADDSRMLLYRLSDRSELTRESNIPKAYPQATLDLLHKLIVARPTWHNDYLKDILNTISNSEPSLKKSQKYKDLRNIAGV